MRLRIFEQRNNWLVKRQLGDLQSCQIPDVPCAGQHILTRGLVGELKSDLMWTHDAVDVVFVVNLVHCHAVAILNRAIAKGEADDFAQLHCVGRNDNLGHNNGV